MVGCAIVPLFRFGYRPGAVPPVAHLADQVHVVIDAMAAAAAETFPQGGTGGGCGFPVQLSPYQSGIISEPAPETSSFHSKARSSDNEFRFVCGAGHPQLVFLATLQELEILTGAICIANVTDMKVCSFEVFGPLTMLSLGVVDLVDGLHDEVVLFCLSRIFSGLSVSEWL